MSTQVVVATPLTSEEDSFALAVVEYGGNLAAAYKSIFPDSNSPGARARDLMCRPEIAKRVLELHRAVDESALITLGSHLEMLANIRDQSILTGQLKVALGAETKRGEAAGYYSKMVAQDPGATKQPAVVINLGSSPANVQEWAIKNGTQCVVIENGK